MLAACGGGCGGGGGGGGGATPFSLGGQRWQGRDTDTDTSLMYLRGGGGASWSETADPWKTVPASHVGSFDCPMTDPTPTHPPPCIYTCIYLSLASIYISYHYLVLHIIILIPHTSTHTATCNLRSLCVHSYFYLILLRV